MLGLKGYVDIVANAELTSPYLPSGNNNNGSSSSNIGNDGSAPSKRRFLVPVEIKTGKQSNYNRVEHEAQVTIYILMLLMRAYGSVNTALLEQEEVQKGEEETIPPASPGIFGLLLYINAHHDSPTACEVIQPSWMTIRSLLQQRNRLASHLLTSGVSGAGSGAASGALGGHASLPPLLKDTRTCENCFKSAECMTEALYKEGETPYTSGCADLFTYTTGHLSQACVDYLRHWNRLLDLEEAAEGNTSHTVWTESSSSRQATHGGSRGTEGGLTFLYYKTIRFNSTEGALSTTARAETSECAETYERHASSTSNPRERMGATSHLPTKAQTGLEDDKDRILVVLARAGYGDIPEFELDAADSPLGATTPNSGEESGGLIGLREGDRVVVSLEATYTATHACPNNDIEDLSYGFSSSAAIQGGKTGRSMPLQPWSIADIEPGVAGGGSTATVVQATKSRVWLALSTLPYRLLRLLRGSTTTGNENCGSKAARARRDRQDLSLSQEQGVRGINPRQVMIRLDKDHRSAISSAQSRSNLFSLMIDSYDRAAFKRYKEDKQAHKSQNRRANAPAAETEAAIQEQSKRTHSALRRNHLGSPTSLRTEAMKNPFGKSERAYAI